MPEANEAGRDLWRQIFDRAIAKPDAAVNRATKGQEAEDTERLKIALARAGWSQKHIEARILAHEVQSGTPSETSPGVAPGLEGHLRDLCKPVAFVMTDLGIRSHEKVVLGIDPKVGPSAAMTNVIMTDEGILAVSSFLFRWCGLIARAYTRALNLDVARWSSAAQDSRGDVALLVSNPDLASYWIKIFFSFATTGTHVLVPFRPATPEEAIIFEQVAWGMEFFAVSHEFAHHALGHRQLAEDFMAQEYQADALAMKICERLEFHPVPRFSNPYNRTGAAATLLLRALEILRGVEGYLGEEVVKSNTHPKVIDRISRILNRNVLQPDQYKMDKEFNDTVLRVMNAVDAMVDGTIRNFGSELKRIATHAVE